MDDTQARGAPARPTGRDITGRGRHAHVVHPAATALNAARGPGTVLQPHCLQVCGIATCSGAQGTDPGKNKDH